MKFAVSCTFHMIDETDLDSTGLQIVEAKNKQEAALKVIIDQMVDYDLDLREDEDNAAEPDYLQTNYDISKDDLALSESEFKAKREVYWRRKVKWEKRDAKERGYCFLFDNQEGASSGVFGVQVLPI